MEWLQCHMTKDLYFLMYLLGLVGRAKSLAECWKSQHRSGSHFWEQLSALIAFTDECCIGKSWHLVGAADRSIIPSLSLLLKRKILCERRETDGICRGHPGNPGAALWHPSYLFPLITVWLLSWLFWYFRLTVPLLPKYRSLFPASFCTTAFLLEWYKAPGK